MKQFNSLFAFVLFTSLAALMLSAGCTQDGSSASLNGGPQRLYAEGVSVLGFEDHNQWSTATSNSTIHTEGAKSLEVAANGWTVVESIPLSSLGAVDNAINLDLRIPQSVYWGDVRMIVKIPSAGIWYQELPGPALSSLPVGTFATVTFPLPGNVVTALSGTYSDLQLSVVLNAPGTSSPYLLDNLQLGQDAGDTETGTPDTDTGSVGDLVTFSFSLPAGFDLSTVVVEAARSMRIADAVHAANTNANVVNMGDGQAEIGADAEVDGSVVAMGDVFLRERATVHGLVRAVGDVDQQNGVVVDGGIFENADVQTGGTYEWKVEWPAATASYALEPDQVLDLAPGSYGALSIKSRAQVTLHGGVYYFDTLMAEPQARLIIAGNGDPVILYVRTALTSRAQLIHSTTSADFFIAFAGEGIVDLDGPFAGTVVAPHATVRLAPLNGGSHEGAFFANRVEAEARTPINFVSFDHWDAILDLCPGNPDKIEPGICGCGHLDVDRDKDTWPDCKDPCRNDPDKVQPGLAGCGYSDNADADSDGLPDRIDDRPTDDSQEWSRDCLGAPDGTPCDDAICEGVFTCQNGQCGNPASCTPDCAGECHFVSVFNRTYWVCDCPVTWEQAKSLCSADRHRALVQIRKPVENELVAKLMSVYGLDEAWIGANDRSAEGRWQWAFSGSDSGRLFWIGDESGRRHFAGTIRWEGGEPSGGTAEDCGVFHGDSRTWSDASCSEARPFICEALGQGQDAGDHADHAGMPEVTAIGDDCVEDPQIDPEDFDVEATNQCTGYGEIWYHLMGCQDGAGGAPPPAGSTCAPWDTDLPSDAEDERRIRPTQDCRLTVPRLEDGRGILCDHMNDCPGNTVCGKFGVCCEGRKCENSGAACETSDDCDTESGESCLEASCDWSECCSLNNPCDVDRECVTSQVCGYAFGNMAKCFEPDEDTGPCEDIDVCEPVDNISIVGDPLEQVFKDPQDLAGEFPGDAAAEVPVDTDTVYEEVDSDPCPGMADCSGAGIAHRWCQYQPVDQVPVVEPVDVEPTTSLDAQSADTDTESVKQVQFTFDPQFDVHYAVTPGPLGLNQFDLGAHAGVFSDVNITDLFGDGAYRQLIDAHIYLRLGLSNRDGHEVCGLTTRSPEGDRSTVKVMGLDFLPAEMADFSRPSYDDQVACLYAYEAFDLAVDQAKKGFRDAEDLLRQYYDNQALGTNFGNLCTVVQEMGNQPDDFPGPANGDCAAETPEETINRFIRYYNEKLMARIAEAADQLIGEGGVLVLDDTEVLADIHDELEEVLWNRTFTVGPVPVNVEVFLSLVYGFDAAVSYTFQPGVALADSLGLMDENEDLTIAYARLNAEPYAASRIGVFMGVGFDFGVVAAKLGVEGVVTLGEISVPAWIGAGLTCDALADERELPPSMLSVMVSSGVTRPEFNIYPKKYQIKMVYDMGVNAHLDNVLSGDVNLRLKLQFLFFSKTWRKSIAHWDGLCPDRDGHRAAWCNPILFRYNEETEVMELPIPYFELQMPMPFAHLPEITTRAPVGTAELDTSRAGHYFWGNQCVIPIE